MEITAEEQNKVKRMKRTEHNLRSLGQIKCTNIQIIGVPEEEEKKKGYKRMFEEIRVEFDQALGVGDGQGSLVCCSPLDHKELDMNE